MSTKLWLGTEESFMVLAGIEEKVANASEELRLRADSWDGTGDDDEDECHWLLEMEGKLATIEIKGSMSEGRAGFWGWYFGYVGYDDIKDAVNDALSKGATDFLFIWNTSGGSVDGIEDMSQFMKDLNKLDVVNSTTSFTSGMAASAGLWLATESDRFYASPMAQVGSIGVLAVHREYTKQMEQWGIKATVFRSAKYKALGNPYEELSAEAEKKIEEDIGKAHEFFVEAIVKNTGMTYEFVSTKLATGELWYAADAAALGLIDRVRLLNEVFVALSKKTNENTDNYTFRTTEVDMKRATITPQMQAAIASGAPVDKVLEAAEESTDKEDLPENDADEPIEEEEVDTSVEGKTDEDESNKEAKSSNVLKEFSALTDQLVQAKVDLGIAEAKLASAESSLEGLKKIAAHAVQRAMVGIGAPAPDLEGLLKLDASLLIQQHAQAEAAFVQRFPVGGRVSQETETGEEDDKAASAISKHNAKVLQDLARINPNK